MLLFRSGEHAKTWSRSRGLAMGVLMSPQQQWDLARIWYADRMSPDWRRRTPAEAEEVFATVGLTGAFWRLTRP